MYVGWSSNEHMTMTESFHLTFKKIRKMPSSHQIFSEPRTHKVVFYADLLPLKHIAIVYMYVSIKLTIEIYTKFTQNKLSQKNHKVRSIQREKYSNYFVKGASLYLIYNQWWLAWWWWSKMNMEHVPCNYMDIVVACMHQWYRIGESVV